MIHGDLIANVQATLMLILLLSLPALGVAIALGLLIGLFQAVTQIQDQSLPMAVKIVAVLAVCAFAGRIINATIIEHTIHLLDQLPVIGRSVLR